MPIAVQEQCVGRFVAVPRRRERRPSPSELQSVVAVTDLLAAATAMGATAHGARPRQ